jgi:hypothetical protein
MAVDFEIWLMASGQRIGAQALTSRLRVSATGS